MDFAERNSIFHYCHVFRRCAIIVRDRCEARAADAAGAARTGDFDALAGDFDWAGTADSDVAKDSLTYEDVLKIVELVKGSPQFSEFRLKVGEIELHLKRKHDGSVASVPTPPTSPGAEARTEAPAPRKRAPSDAWPEHWVVVRSPMVGTFYRAPAPGACPFVELGQTVEADAIVCIIEVMKLMNSIPAGARGAIRAILIEDAQAVEYGEPLVVLEPQ